MTDEIVGIDLGTTNSEIALYRDGRPADRLLAIEPITNPAFAMKKISDTTLHKIIAAMIPPPESGPFGPAASISLPKGTSRETKTT
jgi:hypothetical protein